MVLQSVSLVMQVLQMFQMLFFIAIMQETLLQVLFDLVVHPQASPIVYLKTMHLQAVVVM